MVSTSIVVSSCENQERLLKPVITEIHSTVDESVQAIALRTIVNPLRNLIRGRKSLSDLDLAFLLVRNDDGAVLGYVPTLAEDSDFDNIRFGLREIGSLAKPITFAIALESRAIATSDLFWDSPMSFPRIDEPSQMYTVSNFASRYTNRALNVAEALGRSSNVVALQIFHRIKPAIFREKVKALRLPEKSLNINLGGIGVWAISPLELAGAYTVFGNDGRLAMTHLIKGGSVPHSGYMTVHASERIFSSETCSAILGGMRYCVTTGTGAVAADLAGSCVGKTGSSTDVWSVLQSRVITGLLWIGHRETNRNLAATGGSLSMPLLAACFRELRKMRPHVFPVWEIP